MHEARKLGSTPEVAQYLKVPERTLTQWRYYRCGPPWISVGRHIRYRWSAVENWLDQQTSPT